MEEELKSGVIMFTDMKDFTAKTSLFTNKRLNDILNNQEKIITDNVNKNSGEIIKSIGDGYMIYFSSGLDAIRAALSIFEDLKEYNKNKKIEIFKIELRVAMDYGDFLVKNNIFGKDYFGKPINIASRLEGITSINGIFVTENVISNIGSKEELGYHFHNIGIKAFKGIFENIKIFELLYIKEDIDLFKKGLLDSEIYNEDFLLYTFGDRAKKIDDLIFKIASIGAIISTQPIPFLDIYNILALQIYLLKEISEIYGFKPNTRELKDIFLSIFGVIGINYLFGQGLLGISKIGLPIIGGYLFIPVTFGFIYAFGKAINSYFYYKSVNKKISDEELKAIFIENMSKGRIIGKEKKSEIIKIGKNNKDIFIKEIKKIYLKYNLKNLYFGIKNKLKEKERK